MSTASRNVKDLPLETARADILLAHSMNGEPLRPRYGFPLRSVAPRMFGTNSVKWLTRIVLSDTRPDHLFTTRLYNRALPGDGAPRPVREVDLNSKLLAPYDGDQLPSGEVEVMGRAWSSTEVAAVEVAVDDGPWLPAALEPSGPHPASWQTFTLTHIVSPGPHRIRSRATDRSGRTQPSPGARNSVHEIRVRAD